MTFTKKDEITKHKQVKRCAEVSFPFRNEARENLLMKDLDGKSPKTWELISLRNYLASTKII